jgi:hypothetical protein
MNRKAKQNKQTNKIHPKFSNALNNKRPMGHIAHLSNFGPYRNTICISFPFATFDPRGPMIY